MDRVTEARVNASLDAIGSLGFVVTNGGYDSESSTPKLTDDEIRRLVEAIVLEGQFILETMNSTPVADIPPELHDE